jgi:hypothetical protein
LNSPPSPLFFIALYPIPGIVSTDIVFPFTYICTQYLHYFHPPTAFPHPFLLPFIPTPSDRNYYALPFSDFVKEKNDIYGLAE